MSARRLKQELGLAHASLLHKDNPLSFTSCHPFQSSPQSSEGKLPGARFPVKYLYYLFCSCQAYT